MMRGEIWVARAELYASKVRPVLIVQSDDYDTYQSSITCLFTTVENANDGARVRVDPDEMNGLESTSFVMLDKVFSFDKADLARRIGQLSDRDMVRVSVKLRAVLGL